LSATIDSVDGVASDSTSVSVTISEAIGMQDSELAITYDIGDVVQLNNFADGYNTPQAFQDEFAQLYQLAGAQDVALDGVVEEVEDARGGEATLEDRLDLMDTATADAQADATQAQTEVDAEEAARAAADAALDARVDDLEAVVAGGGDVPVGTEGQVVSYNSGGVPVAGSENVSQYNYALTGLSTIRRTEATFIPSAGITCFVTAINGHAKNFVPLLSSLAAYTGDQLGVFDTTQAIIVEVLTITTTTAQRQTYYKDAGWTDGALLTMTLVEQVGILSGVAIFKAKVGAFAIADVLTTAQEGAGNGMDADTVDGSHASAFPLLAHGHTGTSDGTKIKAGGLNIVTATKATASIADNAYATLVFDSVAIPNNSFILGYGIDIESGFTGDLDNASEAAIVAFFADAAGHDHTTYPPQMRVQNLSGGNAVIIGWVNYITAT